MFLKNIKSKIILFVLLIFLLAFPSNASIDESFPKKIDSDAINFLSASSEISWQFFNCGKKNEPLQIKTVTLTSIPVRAKEFHINIVNNKIKFFQLSFYFYIVERNSCYSSRP